MTPCWPLRDRSGGQFITTAGFTPYLRSNSVATESLTVITASAWPAARPSKPVISLFYGPRHSRCRGGLLEELVAVVYQSPAVLGTKAVRCQEAQQIVAMPDVGRRKPPTALRFQAR